ncbi:Hypothetical predicted protein [Pelobates cultripes]|uniref:Uncharacterized protein n=1 Tax=Pelobates cultripes TaxID=61616 RepID=A0AAD1S586_PELCU|nr:Hypothetical predicted protein [Pelobates cultripes]
MLETVIDGVMEVTNQKLRDVQKPTSTTEDAIVQVVATDVKLVEGVLQITSNIIDKATKTALECLINPAIVSPLNYLISINVQEVLLCSFLSLSDLSAKTQIPSTPFKDQVSEDGTLEDYLDLEMSITSANCSLRKAGSTLSLDAEVKVVSESLGVLVSAPAAIGCSRRNDCQSYHPQPALHAVAGKGSLPPMSHI